VQLTGYADDINIIGINKRTVSELYEELREIAKEAGLNIGAERKQKQWYKPGEQE
jgi:GTPase